jgi:hypothetical protein
MSTTANIDVFIQWQLRSMDRASRTTDAPSEASIDKMLAATMKPLQ